MWYQAWGHVHVPTMSTQISQVQDCISRLEMNGQSGNTHSAIILFISLGRLLSTCSHSSQTYLPYFQYSIYHHSQFYVQDIFVEVILNYHSFRNWEEL